MILFETCFEYNTLKMKLQEFLQKKALFYILRSPKQKIINFRCNFVDYILKFAIVVRAIGCRQSPGLQGRHGSEQNFLPLLPGPLLYAPSATSITPVVFPVVKGEVVCLDLLIDKVFRLCYITGSDGD